MRGLSRAAAISAAAVFLLSSAVTMTAATANAAECNHPSWSKKDTTGSGYTNAYSVAVHTGPYSTCNVSVWIGTNEQKLNYDCYKTNSVGNTWTHLRGFNGEVVGWVWDQYLDDGGSLVPC